jgi:UDP-2,3-diacylglucosamine pyrophosphatase LpxH
MQPGPRKVALRSVFVSDVHLGSRDCRATELLEFLAGIEVDYLFLVGDIVDLWSLRKNFYWQSRPGNARVLRFRVRQPRDPAPLRALDRLRT